MTMPLMDNCCTCGASRAHAAVKAVFHWPGFLPFTTIGTGDTLNARYLTLTITIIDDNGVPVTKSISCNNLNGCFSDSITGTDATVDGYWDLSGPGLRIAWPP